MNCAAKDGLLIFLLVLSSVLATVLILLCVFACRKRVSRCG